MSYALVFSGQGHQHPGTLPWLAEDERVRDTCGLLGVADWRAALEDRDWATANANAQVLLTGLALAAWSQLAPGLPPPAGVAGYSVGELPAFAVAGVLDPRDALRLARRRAEAMDRCARESPGGLLGVSGLAPAAIEALCRETGLAVAIRNGVDSAVLGGPQAGLDAAERAAVARGARATRLGVGIASHTPWMRGAAEDFARTLAATPMRAPATVLFGHAGDRLRDAVQARDALAAQIAATVRWDECMDALRARGPDRVLEIGPGHALARLWNPRHPDIPARSCDDFRSAEAVVRWLLAA
jgi:[acyl-carrier-protein] S-malonyltransferase